MRTAFTVTIAFIVAAFVYFFKPTGSPAKSDLSETKSEKGNGVYSDQIDEAIRFEIERTKDPKTGTVPTERLLVANKIREERIAIQKALGMDAPVPGINWQERGPNNVGGRTRAVIYDLSDAANGYKKVWAGGVAGGLWYCNDISAPTPVWNNVNDHFENMAVTAIAQDPIDNWYMYFGTGEGWFNSSAVKGMGVWASTSKGIFWEQLPSTNTSIFQFIQRIKVTNSRTILVCTRDGGVQRSTDFGMSWSQVLGGGIGGSLRSFATDIEIAPNGYIYVAIAADGIYRSTDDGRSFEKIYTCSFGELRIEMGSAASDGGTIYTLIETSQGSKITKTINANSLDPSNVQWTTPPNPLWCDQGWSRGDFTRGQAGYDLICSVDPVNSNRVYIGGIDILKSEDGGNTFNQITQWAGGCVTLPYVHADIHEIVFRPDSPAEFLVGCDGGIFRTTDAGDNFTERNNSYNIFQCYSAAIHPAVPDYFLTGSQDNGTQKFTSPGINNTIVATGGDGGFCHIDENNGNFQITSYINNNYFVSVDGGNVFQSFSFAGGLFINPTDFDDTRDILYGNYTLGEYFRWDNPGSGQFLTVAIPEFDLSNISHIAISPIILDRVYFGLDNGSVVSVDNANTSSPIAKIIKPGQVFGYVSCIAIDPSNEDHILVTYSNYGVTSVFETTNASSGSPTWTEVEGNLPDMPVRWAMFDPRNSDWAILATELGIWSTNNLDGPNTDWQPTNTGFANTRVDMLQYRSSDRTLAAATHGRGLFTTIIPPATTPGISFEKAIELQPEQFHSVTGCRTYKDYTVNMLIDAPPTGDASVTLNIKPGTTAEEGSDFDFTTNGSFTSPSKNMVFVHGSAAPKAITLRIYDDAEVEQEETIILGYNISGATDAVRGAGFQAYSFTITGNDRDFDEGSSFVVGLGNTVLQTASVFRSDKLKHRSQSLFTASELYAAGFPGEGNITGLTFTITDKASTRPFNNLTVYMVQTGETSAGTGFHTSGVQNVFAGNLTTVEGINVINFITPFRWDGFSNVIVQFCFDNESGQPDASSDIVQGTNNALGSGVAATIYSDYSSGILSGCALQAVHSSSSRIHMNFIFGSTTIANSLIERSEKLGPYADLYFFADNRSLIARIRNLTSHDYGCTEVKIDRAGFGAKPFVNSNFAHYLLDKTIRILPENNDPNGSFELTLYYTPAEINGWQAVTGQEFDNNIKMIKTAGSISDVTPGNPNGGGAIEIVNPIIGRLTYFRSLTYTFNSGFSGFGAGIPSATALPVSLIDLKGELKGNNVLLSWSTSSESNSKGFEIERSYDGINFSKVGFVASKGNSQVKQEYQFKDPALSEENNYYRLKQTDIDGIYEYSKVILVKDPNLTGDIFKILNNPFRDNLKIQFGSKVSGRVEIKLVDLSGRIMAVRNYNLNASRALVSFDQLYIPGGVYFVEVRTERKRYVRKLMKE
ncbi:MAG: T9SS type A sorting domain-containing protein [Chitinophagaceae bacterium]|nr:T9SS type A sorting domain-containing protein [Chitinophagaceae bacterium]